MGGSHLNYMEDEEQKSLNESLNDSIETESLEEDDLA